MQLSSNSKSYFEIEGVDLKFSDGALRAVVQEALARKTGARGLRSILEENMLDIMYDVPSDNRIKEVVITEEMIVEEKADPIIVYKTDEELQQKKQLKLKRGRRTSKRN